MAELKFVITGTAGVGKTTAIAAISDVPPLCTDADTTDELAQIKDATTVAFDFGEVNLVYACEFTVRRVRNASVICGKFSRKVHWA